MTTPQQIKKKKKKKKKRKRKRKRKRKKLCKVMLNYQGTRYAVCKLPNSETQAKPIFQEWKHLMRILTRT